MTSAVATAPQSAAADMIPKSRPSGWQQAMRETVRDIDELLDLLGLNRSQVPLPCGPGEQFPLRVPRSYVARMRHGDPQDPLLRQVLPLKAEDISNPGFTPDPVGDLASERAPGLLHKYPGRALLITTGACAVHCRYCFRREFPYTEQNAAAGEWHSALDVIRKDESLEEIILSGGDPLSLSDHRLAALADELDAIPHLQRLRIHTRTPIVLPERIDDQLLAWLGEGRLKRIIVLHCNHANELDEAVGTALGKLRLTGALLLNQAVLLRGVNDDLQSLAQLSRALFAAAVVPYYLHQLDRVQGAAHFEVPDDDALRLYQELQDSLPGYMVPRLVREISGELSKRLLQQLG